MDHDSLTHARKDHPLQIEFTDSFFPQQRINLAQSVAWRLPDGPDALAVAGLERSVLAEGGVVLRYGQFYGPGTYNEQQLPVEPRVQIDGAAERTVEALGEPTGVVIIID
jgi:hypothetical protein